MKRERLSRNVVLATMAGLAVVVLVSYLAYSFHKHYEDTVVSQTHQQLLMSARSIAVGIEEFIGEHSQDLKTISRNPMVQEKAYKSILVKKPPTKHCVCRDLYEAHKDHVDAFTILDAKGIMLRRIPHLEERIGRDHSDKPGVAYVIKEHKAHVSDVFYNNLGNLAISISEPVFYNDEFAGMVRWMIQVDTISKRFIETAKVGREGYVWMFDNRNIILTHPREEFVGMPVLDFMRKMHKETFDESELEKHIREEHDYLNRVGVEEEGYGMYIGCITGMDELTAYKRVAIGDRNWHLIINLPYSEIAGPINEHARNTFGLAVIVILLFGLGGVVLFRTQKRKAELETETKYLREIAESAEALRQSEEKLTGIVDSVTDYMIMLDEQFSIVWANDLANQEFGPDLVGKKCYRAYHGYDEVCKPCIVKQCFEDGMVHKFETEITRANGHQMTFRCTASVAARDEDGRPKMVVEFLRDVTERKQAEEALRESKEKLTGIIDSATDYMIMLDEEFNIVWTNDFTKEWFGPDLVGKKCYSAYHGRDEVCEPCIVKQCFENGKVHEFETEIIGPDGNQKAFWCTAGVAAWDEDSKPKMVVEFLRDITERKQAEERIQVSLREKEVLLKEVHHRVKNNLQVISSLLKLQAGYVEDRTYLEMFQESQNRIISMALVHEKLYQSEDLASISLNEYINHLTSALFRSYGVDTGRIALKIDAADVMLGVDTAIPCGLIINELISNSLKYAFPEGKEGEIKITLRPTDENEMELTVSDNGVSVPKDLDLRHVKSLGLKLVSILTDQIGGKIEIDRSRGTKFQIKFKKKRYQEERI